MIKNWYALILLAVALTGCASGTPTPSPVPTAAPVAVVATATEQATPTPLSPAATLAATFTAPVQTNPTGATAAVTPTVVPTKAQATRAALAASPTAASLVYAAARLIEPGPGDARIEGKDDLQFKWRPVANLGENECYQVTVRITNLADAARRYGQSSYLARDTCNSSVSGGNLQFTLYIKRHGQPDYEGLVAIASQAAPSNTYQVRWWVTVTDPDQKPLGSSSEPLEFTLNSP